MNKFILALILVIATVNSASVTHYQSTWYISRDDTVIPPKHFIGIKNFESDQERSYYFNEDIKKTDPNFRVRADRDWTDADGDNLINGAETTKYTINRSYDRFNKQFIHYLPKMDLADSRGGFYVLEDAGNDFHYLCEIRYFIQYFQTYQQAKLQYEILKRDFQNERKLVLGGPNGIVDSNDKDYFTEKYVNYWCSYHFGINLNEDNSNASGERFRVLLNSNSDNYEFPVSHNVDNSYAPCPDGIDLTAGSEEIYVPSEFYSHCSNRETFQNWADTDIPYSYCFNSRPEISDARALYYAFDSYCKTAEGKTFMKLNDIGYTNNLSISFVHTVTVGPSPQSTSIPFQTLWNNDDNYYTYDLGYVLDISYNNGILGVTRADIVAQFNAVQCNFSSASVSYINVDQSCTHNVTDFNPGETSGTLRLQFNVSLRLILPFLNNTH